MISDEAMILALETSTKNCSVALFNHGEIVSFKEKISKEYSHDENVTVFISMVLNEAKIDFSKLDAIALSKGPGSYTGLRIGASIAKGLSYSLDIPLISISTLKAMAFCMAKEVEYDLFCPMIDARRMEVFSALYNQHNCEIREIKADIVDSETYLDFLKKPVVFFGDGALKCKQIINHKNAIFIEDIFPSAKNMGELAYKKFKEKVFEDVAYFEPFYLKDFLTGRKG